jgi:hypothetical protein
LHIGSKFETVLIVAEMAWSFSSQAGTASGLNADALRQLAEAGNTQAQHDSGQRLLSREGISIDMGRVAYHLQLAADQGLAQAHVNYGFCSQKGEGISIDKRSAAHYFKLAVDQGYDRATCPLINEPSHIPNWIRISRPLMIVQRTFWAMEARSHLPQMTILATEVNPSCGHPYPCQKKRSNRTHRCTHRQHSRSSRPRFSEQHWDSMRADRTITLIVCVLPESEVSLHCFGTRKWTLSLITAQSSAQ